MMVSGLAGSCPDDCGSVGCPQDARPAHPQDKSRLKIDSGFQIRVAGKDSKSLSKLEKSKYQSRRFNEASGITWVIYSR